MTTWRKMKPNDINAVHKIGNIIHAALPEDQSIPAERLRLFPDGCLVLASPSTNTEDDNNAAEEEEVIGGYIISHPIKHRQPPPLNTLLGDIPIDADQFYLHDVAILPEFRGKGLAAMGIAMALVEADKRFQTTCLVSVYGTAKFWGRFGFAPVEDVGAALKEKVRGYGEDAIFMERRNK
ncbi:putative gcn5-related n-acetyltransferase [Podospora australis]|uniref:Gcn5-related n-acetyltransferase n=1 Tax=Podospora australis TaxID=1536484 RepID=A0AAN6WP11_9PEZI|nr:putative gcn5-related n-acetyltransferase [Podospora australis]